MLPDYEIVLGGGIGKILFGITKEELVEILGVPDEIEKPDDVKGLNWKVYNYDSIGCSFSFNSDHEEKLVEISIENGYFHVHNLIRVGLKKEELLKLGSKLRLGKKVIEDLRSEEYPARELISYAQSGLGFYLDDGIISAIRILPLYSKEGFVIWPNNS